MVHKVYASIVASIRLGRLIEPFTARDFKQACPGFAPGTYNAFLHKHALGNPGGYSELFRRGFANCMSITVEKGIDHDPCCYPFQ
jgi:hypothetical protein